MVRVATFLLFCTLSTLVACSGADMPEATATSVAPVADESGAALALAKACITEHGYKTVWGTTPVIDEAKARHFEQRTWFVYVPESGHDDAGHVVALGVPLGIAITVDLDAKTCHQMIQE